MTDALTKEDLDLLDEIALDAIEPVAPPAFVRARVLELIRATPQRDVNFLRSSEGNWRPVPMLKGIDFKKLSSNKERNTVTLLMRFVPGAILPAHVNHGAEDAFIVAGSCTLGGIPAAAGDFHHIEGGELHEEIVASHEGCLVLLVVDYADYIAA